MNRWIAFFRWLSIVVAVIAAIYAFLLFTGLLFGFVAHGQEYDADGGLLIRPPAMLVLTNRTNASIQPFHWTTNNAALLARISGPQPPVPAIPKRISRTVSTNDSGERIVVTIEKPPDPTPLIQDKPRTNAFWASCPECKVRAIRKPLKIEIVGARAVTGGDEVERMIYFRCCQQEFKRRNFKFVEEEIAIEVPSP